MQTGRSDAFEAESRRQINALLASRLRATLWIVLCGLLALSVRDLLSGPSPSVAIYVIRTACGVLAIALLAALHIDRLARHPVALALVLGVAVCADIAAVSNLRQDPATPPFLLSAVALFGATVFRCGLGPQLALVATAELAILWNAYVVTGNLAGVVAYNGITAVIAFAMSVYVAGELERQRREIERGALALGRSEAHFRSLIENSSELITVITPDGTILYDSPAHERLLGYRRDERIGTNALALIHPDDAPGVLDAIARGRQIPEQVVKLEYRYRHKNGSWRHIEAIGQHLLDDPNVGTIVVNSRDITERHQMEADLRRSETYLKTLFDYAPMAFYLHDLQGRFVDGNRAAEELVGYKKAELIGKSFLSLILTADELPRAADILRQSALGPVGPVQLTLRHEDGRLVPVEVRTIPIELNGETLVLGIGSDVTERNRTAEELRVAEERHHRQRDALITLTGSENLSRDNLAAALRQIAETDARTLGVARTSIWRYNRDHTAMQCVDLYDVTTDRHSAGAELSVADHSVYCRSLADLDVLAADDALCDPRTCELASDYLRPLGISSVVDASIRLGGVVDGVLCHEHIGPPRKWTADEKNFAVAVANLVSLALEGWERKQAEHAQSRLTAILDATPDLVAMADASASHMLYMNPAGRKMMGIGLEQDVSGLLIADLHPEWTNKLLRDEIFPTAIRDGVWMGESAFLNRDGREVPVLMVVLAHKSPSGKVERFSTVSRDITERKSFEAQLLDAKQAAETANRAKSEFLANMSHEIRTPMNGIIGMTDLALQTELTGEQREYLEMVAASGDALLTVINDVLDFSKIEAGKLDLDPVAVDIREILATTVRPLAMRVHLKDLELAYEVHPDVAEVVILDPHRLRQVLTNLIGNATKFTEQGEILISLTAEPRSAGQECLHFSVRDSGVGIPPEKQQVIFQAFEQADSSTTRKYGGSGLGLTISRKLVEMMGGRIWVESEVGRGSTFHFTVPCERSTTMPKSAPATTTSLDGLPVMVVDDNATNRRILNEMLLGWRMCPATVDGPDAALGCLAHAVTAGRPFLLVLIDAHMPEKGGFELAARIKQTPELAGATLMMLSSADLTGEAARCRELGFAAFLTKPIRQSELLDAILTALARAPAAPEPTDGAVRTQGAAAPRPAGHRSLHVLLAEDNVVNQTLVTRLLEKHGDTSVVVGNGRDAVAALAKEAFDVVFMDVQMPELDGFEATAEIRAGERETGTHVPIIAMTAHAMTGDELRCRAAGMDDYVAKPIDRNRLFALLDALPAAKWKSSRINEKTHLEADGI